jgi:hypothetical protein
VTSVNSSKGYNSTCAGAYLSFNVLTQAQWWASNATGTTQAYQVKAASETDSLGWKKFNSASASSNIPSLSVTYNRRPNTAGTPTHTPGTSSATTTMGWTNTLTPSLKATVTDPYGGSVKALFDVIQGSTNTKIVTVTGSSVTSGGTSVGTVPSGKLVNGTWYIIRAWGNDGALTSAAWSTGYDRFTPDLTAPGAPTVSSTMFPANQWSNPTYGADNLAHFTAAATVTDASSVQWSLDAQTFTSSKTVTGTTAADITVAKASVTDGAHTLYVRNLDPAGNAGAVTSFVFYAGTGVSLTAPTANQVTARRLQLGVATNPALTTLGALTGFQYRRGTADTWHTIGIGAGGDVYDSAGTAITAWPGLVLSGSVNVLNTPGSKLTWDAGKTLGAGGVVDVRALFANGSNSTPATVVFDPNAGGAASADVGPGSVNLQTGQYSLDDSDADFLGVSIGRSFGSRSLTAGTDDGQAGAFGPQWAATGLTDPSGDGSSDYTAVRKTSTTSVDVVLPGGDTIAFTQKSGSTTAWVSEPGAEDLVLAGALSGATFTLTDLDGTVSTFTDQTASGRTLWPITAVTPTGAGNTARYSYTIDGTAKLRLYRVIAPNPGLS